MITRKFWIGSLVVSGLFVACGGGDDNDPPPDECPDGTLECECLEDDECEGALVCASGVCVQPDGGTGGRTGSGGEDSSSGGNGDGDGDGDGTGGSETATGGNGSGGDETGDGDGDGSGGLGGGSGDGDGDGEGGLGGFGGSGDGDGDGDGDGGVECEDGCALLTVPFTAFDTGTVFQIRYNPDVDLTDAVVTARVFVEMQGNSGGVQLFAQSGAPNYPAKYHGWTDFYTLTSDWVDLTLDLSAIADPDPTANGFTKSETLWVGLNLAVAGSWGAEANVGTVKVYVEDITFTAGADDVTFAVDLEGLQPNPYVSTNVPGSTAVHYP